MKNIDVRVKKKFFMTSPTTRLAFLLIVADPSDGDSADNLDKEKTVTSLVHCCQVNVPLENKL